MTEECAEVCSWSSKLVGLQAEERRQRKEALQSLLDDVKTIEDPEKAAEAFAQLHGAVFTRWDDEVEACRELAVQITARLTLLAPPSDFILTYLMAAARRRLAATQTIEPAEELRREAMSLLFDVVGHYKESKCLAPYYDDYVDILVKAFNDDFADVKNLACQTTVALANALSDKFHMRAEVIVTAAVTNFNHRHSKVRTLSVECIGAAVSHGNAECFEAAIGPLATMLFDENSAIRLQVTKVVGEWMIDFRERYSYWHKMIPLLLASLCDSMEMVYLEAKTIWENVGLQYMNENEEELKNQTDFLTEPPIHYPPVSRPNLGCRILVRKNMGKIIPAVIKDLDGWLPDPRLRSAQILCWIVLHTEAKNLLYSMDIINCLFKSAQDDDQRVVTEIARAAELFGYFISPSVWWDLIVPDTDSWYCLLVLANIIKGSNPTLLEDKYLKRILKELVTPRLLDKREPRYQINLLFVCESLMNVCTLQNNSIIQDMFNIIFTVYATPKSVDIEHHSLCLIGKLSETVKVGSTVDDLYCIFIRSLLVNITSDPCFWSMSSLDCCTLNAILVHTGPAVGLNLHLIAPLLVEALSSNITSADVKLELFTSLCSMLLRRDERFKLTEPDKLSAFMNVLLQDIIIPNLNWSVGITSEILRTTAVCCLCTILQEGESISKLDGEVDFEKCVQPIDLFPNKEILQNYVDILLPKLVELVNDNVKNTRQYALKAIRCLVTLAKKNNCFKLEHLHKSYSEIMSRLNDSNDQVRHSVVETLCVLFMSRPEPYDVDTYNYHIDALYNAMLIHLDDPDTIFQDNILDALKKVGVVHPKLLKGKVDSNGRLYKNQKALEHLNKHLESLSI